MRLKRNVLPVFFHNMKGYDGHLLCESAFAKKVDWEISIIPQTKEKYIGMSAKFPVETIKKKGDDLVIKMNIQFKDSAQFLAASLDSLVQNLHISELIYSQKCIPDNAPLSLVMSKGYFPYEWFDSEEKLDYEYLPSQDEFYDRYA